MTLILPIVITAVILGVLNKRMTGYTWLFMGFVIIATITYFYIKH